MRASRSNNTRGAHRLNFNVIALNRLFSPLLHAVGVAFPRNAEIEGSSRLFDTGLRIKIGYQRIGSPEKAFARSVAFFRSVIDSRSDIHVLNVKQSGKQLFSDNRTLAVLDAVPKVLILFECLKYRPADDPPTLS